MDKMNNMENVNGMENPDDMENTELVYDEVDALNYIEARCNLDRETIEKVVELDGEYVLLISEEGSDLYWEKEIAYITERCDVDEVTIDKILLLNQDYMRSVGIVDELPESMMEEIAEIIRSSGKPVPEN